MSKRLLSTVALTALILSMIATTPAGAQQTQPAPAKDGNPHLWQPRVTSVTVFKNGLGFFVREGDVTLRDGWCLAREIPPAAFGTLAIAAADQDKLVDVVGAGPGEIVEFDGIDAADTLAERLKRLGAMRDLKVQLTYERYVQSN